MKKKTDTNATDDSLFFDCVYIKFKDDPALNTCCFLFSAC